MMSVIDLEDDIRITTFKPPSGFDPLSATASELEQYGFPARPDHPRLLKLYQHVFTRLKGRLKYVEPSLRVSHDEPLNPRRPVSLPATTGPAVSSSRRQDDHSSRC